MSQSSSRPSSRLAGKVAVITGGATGIGFATARLFLAEGVAHVYIFGRRQAKLDEAVAQLGSTNVTAVAGDVAKLADVRKLYAKVEAASGRVDVLVANAAIAIASPLADITDEQINAQLAVNIKVCTAPTPSVPVTQPRRTAAAVYARLMS
jgi:NAD(P)-dependent dehydrogenase (short-subunit alcohol dehydrogenase family)